MKRVLLIFLCISILICCTSVYALTFSDLTEEHWAYNSIMDLTNDGIINGYTDGTFRPQNTITRAEFFKLITIAYEDEENYEWMKPLFPDHWGMIYIAVMMDQGLVMDENALTGYDNPISRLEMAVVLAKVALKLGLNDYAIPDDETFKLPEFNDLNDVPEEYRFYIQHVANLGMINGYPDGTFRPNSSMTRAEVATVIHRLYERIGGE